MSMSMMYGRRGKIVCMALSKQIKYIQWICLKNKKKKYGICCGYTDVHDDRIRCLETHATRLGVKLSKNEMRERKYNRKLWKKSTHAPANNSKHCYSHEELRIKINSLVLQLWILDSQTRLDRRKKNKVYDK